MEYATEFYAVEWSKIVVLLNKSVGISILNSPIRDLAYAYDRGRCITVESTHTVCRTSLFTPAYLTALSSTASCCRFYLARR